MFVWTMNGVLVVDAGPLAQEECERACVDAGGQGVHESGECQVVVEDSVELGRRMLVPLLNGTVMDRRHCWMVVSSNEISKRWCGGNGNKVTSSGVGGS